MFNKTQALEDLEQLDSILREEFAFFSETIFNSSYPVMLDAAKHNLPTTTEEMAELVKNILALSIDTHSTVKEFLAKPGYSDCQFYSIGENIIAISRNRENLVDEKHPIVTEIDGIDINQWIKATKSQIPRGSEQWVRAKSARALSFINHWRKVLDIPISDKFTLTLTSTDNKSKVIYAIDLLDTIPRHGTWPNKPSQVIDNILYLRIPNMIPKVMTSLEKWINNLNKFDKIILDIRDNSGGYRDSYIPLIKTILPLDSDLKLINVAYYKKSINKEKDYLESRQLYPIDSSIWTSGEKEYLTKIEEGFTPSIDFPRDDYSIPHYHIAPKGENISENLPKVAIIMNSMCLSAADIFLQTLKGFDHIKLFGEASGGASSAPQIYQLKHSKVHFKIGTMLSFQPNGHLYDGEGIVPDQYILPSIESLLEGEEDNQLQSAIKWLKL